MNDRAQPSYLKGIGLRGFRSFGPERQRVAPLERVALIVGRNDSGKSNILHLITTQLSALHEALGGRRNQLGSKWDPLDTHMPACPIGLSIAVDRTELVDRLTEKNARIKGNRQQHLEKVLQREPLSFGSDLVWFELEANSPGGDWEVPDSTVQALAAIKEDQQKWVAIEQALTQRGSNATSAIKQLHPQLYKAAMPGSPPKVTLIPAVREVRDGDGESDDPSGIGLTERLQSLQNPGPLDDDKRDQWEALNRFVQEVLENDTATLEIPHEDPEIVVNMDNKRLPLNRRGTGIQEVVIIAATATVLEKQILCIEEPELHLHPLLQRRLIEYLVRNTTNQYLISTHSAHVLDVPGVSIHHVTYDGESSHTQNIGSADDRFRITRDLGYRPSDLVQTNCAIWVEGPSDHIYLNYWLAQAAPDLAEGLHYKIMHYGGKLMSHLSGTGEQIADGSSLVHLPYLNRNSAIVMDSDRDHKGQRLNETKLRIREEFENRKGFVWVTEGREIETYIPEPIRDQAVAMVHQRAKPPKKRDQYSRPLLYKVDRKAITPNKVRIAREVVSLEPSLDELDLSKQTNRLVSFIREANHPYRENGDPETT